jgi:hypothetical protein
MSQIEIPSGTVVSRPVAPKPGSGTHTDRDWDELLRPNRLRGRSLARDRRWGPLGGSCGAL